MRRGGTHQNSVGSGWEIDDCVLCAWVEGVEGGDLGVA